MSSFTVEYKKKNTTGFIHSRRVVDNAGNLNQIVEEVFGDGTQFPDGLDFFTVRAVKAKPSVLIKEVKK